MLFFTLIFTCNLIFFTLHLILGKSSNETCKIVWFWLNITTWIYEGSICRTRVIQGPLETWKSDDDFYYDFTVSGYDKWCNLCSTVFPGGSSFHPPPPKDGQDGLSERREEERSHCPSQPERRRSRNTFSGATRVLEGDRPEQHGAGREVQARRCSS